MDIIKLSIKMRVVIRKKNMKLYHPLDLRKEMKVSHEMIDYMKL